MAMAKVVVALVLVIGVVVGVQQWVPTISTMTGGFVLLPGFERVKLSGGKTLNVARFEVTVGEWRACVEDGACPAVEVHGNQPMTHPATMLNWFDAQTYIGWLSARTGMNIRLPSRDEWMEIAGNHKPVKRRKLFDDPRLAWAANYDIEAEPRSKQTQAGGHFGANIHGIHDIKGNVWEWTSSLCSSRSRRDRKNGCQGVGRVAMGSHLAVLSELVRDPGNASCGAGLPPSNMGLRIVY